jgi:hypothetical protein
MHRPRNAREQRQSFRREIQGLRALGLLLVFMAHAELSFGEGGFVALDTFFVMSGFLITGLVLKEMDRTGSLSLSAFYGRRVRRLLLKPGDVAIGISHSGATQETLEMLSVAASSGATTVALTNVPDSPLVEVADIVLTTATHETTFRPAPMASRLPQIIVLDLVYVAVAQRRHEQTIAALRITADAVSGHRKGPRVKKVGQ